MQRALAGVLDINMCVSRAALILLYAMLGEAGQLIGDKVSRGLGSGSGCRGIGPLTSWPLHPTDTTLNPISVKANGNPGKCL